MANHALLVGVDRYGTRLETLSGAVADMVALAGWLVERGEVSPEHLHLALAPADPQFALPPALLGCPTLPASVTGIDRALRGLRQSLAGAPAGRLFFAFSGHGASANQPAYTAEAICLEGYTGGDYTLALETGSLIAVLEAIPAEERFIFLDGCRNDVFEDDSRFAVLGQQPARAPGARRTFILYATASGKKAAEADGRGLFSRHLVYGLNGAGNAKRFDFNEDGETGCYRVTWSRLISHVQARVAADRNAARLSQLVQEDGERPAGHDPVLATFPEDHFPKSRLTVSLLRPAPPPAGAALRILREGALDPVDAPFPSGVAEMSVELPPSVFRIAARAEGYRSSPAHVPLSLYDPAMQTALALDPIRVLGPDGLEAANGQPKRGGAFGPESSGEATLAVYVNGQPLGGLVPAPLVALARESGAQSGFVFKDEAFVLAPGLWRVRIIMADNRATEQLVDVMPGVTNQAYLGLPDLGTELLELTLNAAHKPPPDEGGIMPSESAGFIAGGGLATVAAFAVAQAAQNLRFDLAHLGLGALWYETAQSGLEIVLADETAANFRPPRARLWRMRERNTARGHPVLRPNPDIPLASAQIAIKPGSFWLELRDADRKRRAGFKLATAILPDHVTLIIRHLPEEGGIVLFQFAIPRTSTDLGELLHGLARAEAVQRARHHGRDPAADPNVETLAAGEWFEPFSAAVAAAAALDRGNFALAGALHRRMDEANALQTDAEILACLLANDQNTARVHATAALESGAAPVASPLLGRFVSRLRSLRIFGPVQRYLYEKQGQEVPHPAWTLRREDDLKPADMPDAARMMPG